MLARAGVAAAITGDWNKVLISSGELPATSSILPTDTLSEISLLKKSRSRFPDNPELRLGSLCQREPLGRRSPLF